MGRNSNKIPKRIIIITTLKAVMQPSKLMTPWIFSNRPSMHLLRSRQEWGAWLLANESRKYWLRNVKNWALKVWNANRVWGVKYFQAFRNTPIRIQCLGLSTHTALASLWGQPVTTRIEKYPNLSRARMAISYWTYVLKIQLVRAKIRLVVPILTACLQDELTCSRETGASISSRKS